jgi:hypothetical protein
MAWSGRSATTRVFSRGTLKRRKLEWLPETDTDPNTQMENSGRVVFSEVLTETRISEMRPLADGPLALRQVAVEWVPKKQGFQPPLRRTLNPSCLFFSAFFSGDGFFNSLVSDYGYNPTGELREPDRCCTASCSRARSRTRNRIA